MVGLIGNGKRLKISELRKCITSMVAKKIAMGAILERFSSIVSFILSKIIVRSAKAPRPWSPQASRDSLEQSADSRRFLMFSDYSELLDGHTFLYS